MEFQEKTKKMRRYAGIVNQDEFIKRCIFIKQRIFTGFSREETAFLLGRTPYHIMGYEDMEESINLNDHDLLLLDEILLYGGEYVFKREEEEDTEKRVLRGTEEERNGIIHYKINHPWTINGSKRPIEIKETSRKEIFPEEKRLLQSTFTHLLKLVEKEYFHQIRTPLEIYKVFKDLFGYDFRPLLLKTAIYHYIMEQKLICLRNKKGQLCFQAKFN